MNKILGVRNAILSNINAYEFPVIIDNVKPFKFDSGFIHTLPVTQNNEYRSTALFSEKISQEGIFHIKLVEIYHNTISNFILIAQAYTNSNFGGSLVIYPKDIFKNMKNPKDCHIRTKDTASNKVYTNYARAWLMNMLLNKCNIQHNTAQAKEQLGLHMTDPNAILGFSLDHEDASFTPIIGSSVIVSKTNYIGDELIMEISKLYESSNVNVIDFSEIEFSEEK